MVVSLNYCSQNGGNSYRAPYYYNGNPNIGPRIIGNLDQYPCIKDEAGSGERRGGHVLTAKHRGFPKLGVPFWGSL